jgi:hypothetical protein
MPLAITAAAINPTILNAGQTDVVVDATVTDDSGVTAVEAIAFDSSTGNFVSSQITLTLATGDTLNGTYRGTIVIQPSISDGQYQIIVIAGNAMSDPTNFSGFAINDDSVISVERGVTGPVVPTPNNGSSETNEKARCCCEVSINVTSGPVNIYVCGQDSRVKSNMPE